jgi:hypothetical protein
MATPQETITKFDVEVSNGCFLLGELAQEGARQRSPPVWVVVKFDEKTDKRRAHYCFDPNTTGKRSTVASDQEARIRLNQSIEHHLWALRMHPTWDTASRVEKSNILCTLAHRIADGFIASLYRGDEEDVRLTRGDVELEQLRDLARFPAYEAESDGHGEVGENGGNAGAFEGDNDPGNGAPNDRAGSGHRDNGAGNQATADADVTMSRNSNDQRYIERTQIKQEPI